MYVNIKLFKETVTKYSRVGGMMTRRESRSQRREIRRRKKKKCPNAALNMLIYKLCYEVFAC